MEIILKEDVTKLGRKGDIVKVAEGYGRNFLLPQRKAIPATPANLKNVEQMRAAAGRKDERDLAAAQAHAAQLENVRLVFERRAGEHDTLFGSVTSMDIAAQLAERGFPIDRRRIEIAEPFKTLGEFQAPIHLHRGVTAQVKLEIRRQAQPGESAPAPSAGETSAS